MNRTLIWVIALCTSVPGFGQMTADEAMRQARQYQQDSQAVRTVVLTERDIKSFLAARTELEKLGPTTNLAQAAGRNAQTLAVLARHGFSLDSFGAVTTSIGLALGSLDAKTNDPAQEEALAKMKEQLTPAQYEMMRQQLDASTAMLADLQKQPAANVELVRKYRDQIEKKTQ